VLGRSGFLRRRAQILTLGSREYPLGGESLWLKLKWAADHPQRTGALLILGNVTGLHFLTNVAAS